VRVPPLDHVGDRRLPRATAGRRAAEKNMQGQGCQMTYFQTQKPNLGKKNFFFGVGGLAREDVGIFYGHLYIFPVLVCGTEKNLATLVQEPILLFLNLQRHRGCRVQHFQKM
jgi:hypothetical protein